MKIKTATLLGLIGAIISIVLSIFYLLINLEVIKFVPDEWDFEKIKQFNSILSITGNLCQIFVGFTFATFFYVLLKNQK